MLLRTASSTATELYIYAAIHGSCEGSEGLMVVQVGKGMGVVLDSVNPV